MKALSFKKTKRFTAATATALILSAGIMFAHGQTPDVSWYNSGAASFTLTTADQLAGLAQLVNEGEGLYGKAVSLGNDIDLSAYGCGVAGWNDGKGWVPIGWSNDDTGDYVGLYALFDGAGFKITGLCINDPGRDQVGLFGWIGGGAVSGIKNLGIEGANIIGKSSVGGVAGSINTTVSNCYVTGTIVGNNNVGGIVGSAWEGAVSNSYSLADVGSSSGTSSNIGGIIGWASGAGGGEVTNITNCYATGTVRGASNVGGIAGQVQNTVISNCAALNSGLTTSGMGVGRVLASSMANVVLTDNVAFTGMTRSGGDGTFGHTVGASTNNGADITRGVVNLNGTVGGMFTGSPWTTAPQKLPGLFGQTVNMPEHLAGSEYAISFNLGGGPATRGTVPADILVLANTMSTAAQKPPTDQFVRPGHTLTADTWFTDPAGTSEFVFGTTPVNDDITLYLSWRMDAEWLDAAIPGSGTAGAPYIISTAKQLAFIALQVNEGDPVYSSAHYRLNNDINIAAYNAEYNGGAGWLPIGTTRIPTHYAFSGVFDGNNKVISGLYINSNESYTGLFGNISGGTVKDLGVDVRSISVGHPGGHIGGIVGQITGANGNVTNCYVVGGTISGREMVGGIAGLVGSNGRVDNCYSDVTVSGVSFAVGGIAGSMAGGSVTNCYALGDIIGGVLSSNGSFYSANEVGGILGAITYQQGTNIISNNAALSPRVRSESEKMGRIFGGTGGTLSGNVAFSGMGGTFTGTGDNGADISGATIISDGTMGGIFGGPAWTTVNGKLPGLFGKTVEIPGHLNGVSYTVDFDLNLAGMTDAPPSSITVFAHWKIGADDLPNANYEQPGVMTDGVWYLDANGEEPFIPDYTRIRDNTTLYLKWIDDPRYESVDIAVSPIVITNEKQLAFVAMRISVNDDTFDYAAAQYKLAASIDLSDYDAGKAFNGGKGWRPVGTVDNPFTGVFDGNNKVISGLRINDSTLSGAGLFGYVDGGSVKDLGVAGVNIIGKGNVGGVAGSVTNSGSVTNCYTTGTVIGYGNNVGGIAGTVWEGTISNSYSTADVTARAQPSVWNGNAGGIVGWVGADVGNAPSVITNCYSIGMVTATAYNGGAGNVGGIAGGAGGATITHCAALNPSVATTGSTGDAGRILGTISTDNSDVTLSNNAAFGAMTISKSVVGDNDDHVDGESLTRGAINGDGTIGGRFNAAPWTSEDGSLPGHGEVLEMPDYLRSLSSAVVTLFDEGVYTYNRAAKTPFVMSVTVGAKMLAQGADYTVSHRDNVNAGTAKVVITGAGVYAGEVVEADFTIEPAAVTVTGLAAESKEYDGTTAVSFSGTPVLSGVISPDDVTLTAGTAAFDSKNVGAIVTLSGYTLGGADGGNYTLSDQPDVTATITAKTVTITASVNSSKEYDGNTAAVISASSVTGTIDGDDVTVKNGTASFANKAVGSNKAVTFAGFSLEGDDAGNYAFSQPVSTTANITAKPVTIVASVNNKEYNGNVAAVISAASVAGAITGDVVTVNRGTASFANKTVGNDKAVTFAGFSLSGDDAGNYTLASQPVSTTANITPKPVTVIAVADDKVYDGTTAGEVVYSMFAPPNPVIAGDNVTIIDGTASFADRHAGTDKPVTFANFALGGTDGGNYALASQPVNSPASITPKTITIDNVTAVNRAPNGTTVVALEGGVLRGVVEGDVVTFTLGTGTMANPDIGNNKPVTTNITLTGANAGNYSLTQPAVTVTISHNTSVADSDRIIPINNDKNATVVTPISVTAFDVTVGPNPVRKSDNGVNIFITGKRIDRGELTIYDASGNVINKINIRDDVIGNNGGRRVIGNWDLRDGKGKVVPEGTYLLRGTIKTVDGKRERVSIIIGVR